VDQRFPTGSSALGRAPIAARYPAGAPLRDSAAHPAPTLQRAVQAGCPVLVADPDSDTREILSRALTHAGYACRTTSSGDEALALAAVAHVVVADLYLRTSADPCVVRPIVRARGTHGARVLVYTAYAGPRDVDWARSSGCDGWLLKPASLQDVLDVIARLESVRSQLH
jgi:CheY-like chemotaxis protein